MLVSHISPLEYVELFASGDMSIRLFANIQELRTVDDGNWKRFQRRKCAARQPLQALPAVPELEWSPIQFEDKITSVSPLRPRPPPFERR